MLSQAWTTTSPTRPSIPTEEPWIREENVTSVGTRRPTRERRGEGGCGGRREKPAPADSEKQLPSPADGERAREAALAPSASLRGGAAPARQGGQTAKRVRGRVAHWPLASKKNQLARDRLLVVPLNAHMGRNSPKVPASSKRLLNRTA
jgi:hypothetical protein